jgi:hypothetical protein
MHLPIGISDFRELVEYKDPISGEGLLYVDKSLLIKEILGDSSKVIILTRPRRFGKTLNLSMLQYFFSKEVGGQLTNKLFDSFMIAKDLKCMEQQGKSLVVFISFKDIKQPNFEFCIEKIGSVIAAVYRTYEKELSSEKLPESDKIYITSVLNQKISQVNLESSIKRLLELLFKYHNIKPILLIDEYDTPLQEAYLNGYYDQLIGFFKNFLSDPLKDNTLLKQAVLTGILRVSKESLFSGLNNVEIYSILNENYSNYFGFTEEEVNNLLIKAHLPIDNSQAKAWYNGYNFAGTTIYNPLSIIKFIKNNGKLKSYWINTSGNKLVENLIIKSSYNVQESITALIAGKTIKENINEHIVFSDLNKSPESIWSLLLMSGYLKYTSCEMKGRRYLCELKLPNKEIEDFYISVVEEWLTGDRGFSWYQEFLKNLTNGMTEEFEEKLQTFVNEVVSFHDVTRKSQESFYHGIMLTLTACLKETHIIESNKESGNGRYDIAIIPRNLNTHKLGIIIELKAVTDPLKLEQAATEALEQIKALNYASGLKSKGIMNICGMSIAFSGKTIKMLSNRL